MGQCQNLKTSVHMYMYTVSQGGESMKQKKKKLICPECGFGRLIDSEEDTKSELREESKIEAGWHPDYFAKCSKCGKQIAIRKIG